MAQMAKTLATNAGDPGLIPRSGRSPGEWNGYPLQYSCLENSTEETGGGGCFLWGHKESDTPEPLTHWQVRARYGRRFTFLDFNIHLSLHQLVEKTALSL